MIVVSGALVLVALVLLIIGLLGTGLGFIWASIATSVVAGVFLLLGALQRRGEQPPALETAGGGADMLERVTAVSVRPREEEEPAEPEFAPISSAGEVSVVPGRPRYHVAGCRFLAGRPDVESIPVEQARGEGYTACGVCKPDAALAATEVAEMDVVAEPEAATEGVLAEAPAPKKAPARKAAAKPAAKKTAAAAKPAAGGAQVVVIPDRDKFHMETCRFVRDVPGAVTISKATAKRQGYTPCGVCKP